MQQEYFKEFDLKNLDAMEITAPPREPSRLQKTLHAMSIRARDTARALGTEIQLGVQMATDDVLTSFEEIAPTMIKISKYVTALSIPVMAAIVAHEQLNTVRDQGTAFGLVGIALLSAGVAIDKIRQPKLDSLPKLRKYDPNW